jgi:predicted transcriptional regulator
MLPKSDQPMVSHTVLRLILGPLETEVMEVLWSDGECHVRHVVQRLGRPIAYTTVMTTLDRLFKKNLACRRMCGHYYVYSALATCQQWRDRVVHDLVAKLLAGPGASSEILLASLLDAIGRQKPKLLKKVSRKNSDPAH